MDLGKIEPQRGSPGIRLDRRFEMAPGRVGILPDERFHAEDVVSDRVIGTEAERGFGFADDIGAAALLLRLGGAREMLFDGHCHRPR